MRNLEWARQLIPVQQRDCTGEVEYARDCGQQAVRLIIARPAEFCRNMVLRIGYWWIGNPVESKRLGSFRHLKYVPQLVFSSLALLGAGLATAKERPRTFVRERTDFLPVDLLRNPYG